MCNVWNLIYTVLHDLIKLFPVTSVNQAFLSGYRNVSDFTEKEFNCNSWFCILYDNVLLTGICIIQLPLYIRQ